MLLDDLEVAFTEQTGAKLVFEASELPPTGWFDVMRPLPEDERTWAARVVLDESTKYPKNYLHDIGLTTVGIFGGLASNKDDGYHQWSDDLGGYAFFGMTHGSAIIGAAYSEQQLPLTFHHEVFHAVDAVGGSEADDARFASAISGAEPYAAPAFPREDLEALRALRRWDGPILTDAVGAYTKKSPGEDQAETARHLLTHLPEALVQICEEPDLAGSQRMLHVLQRYADVPGGPGIDHWVDVALGRTDFRERERQVVAWKEVWQPGGGFVVHGAEDANGVNWTLRAQVASFGVSSASLAEVATPASQPELVRAEVGQVLLLADYLAYIGSNWPVSDGTRTQFEQARAAITAAIPRGPVAYALAAASLDDLAALQATDPAGVVAELAGRGVRVNPYLSKVDDRVGDPEVAAAIRRVQPSTVRIQTPGGAASGVNLSEDGMVLTAAHVPDRIGRVVTVEFPDGSRFSGTCVALDARLDLALVDIDGTGLPWASIAPAAPTVGDPVVVIGQPGSRTPDGHATGYDAFHVSVGQIRGILDDPLGDQSLGRTSHDAWTYWGHSGSPLFDREGRIVALHNSWDPDTAMRHAVTWEAIARFTAP